MYPFCIHIFCILTYLLVIMYACMHIHIHMHTYTLKHTRYIYSPRWIFSQNILQKLKCIDSHLCISMNIHETCINSYIWYLHILKRICRHINIYTCGARKHQFNDQIFLFSRISTLNGPYFYLHSLLSILMDLEYVTVARYFF